MLSIASSQCRCSTPARNTRYSRSMVSAAPPRRPAAPVHLRHTQEIILGCLLLRRSSGGGNRDRSFFTGDRSGGFLLDSPGPS